TVFWTGGGWCRPGYFRAGTTSSWSDPAAAVVPLGPRQGGRVHQATRVVVQADHDPVVGAVRDHGGPVGTAAAGRAQVLVVCVVVIPAVRRPYLLPDTDIGIDRIGAVVADAPRPEGPAAGRLTQLEGQRPRSGERVVGLAERVRQRRLATGGVRVLSVTRGVVAGRGESR